MSTQKNQSLFDQLNQQYNSISAKPKNPFTLMNDAQLLALRMEGKSANEIGAKINRSGASVTARIGNLKKKAKAAKLTATATALEVLEVVYGKEAVAGLK